MKRITTTIVILSILLLAAAIWWQRGSLAVDANNKEQKIFVIKQGEGMREIANNLKKQGLIQDPIVFFLVVKKMGIDNKIQAGDFRLYPSMTAADIAQSLTHGTLDIWVTVPEGKRAEEVSEILSNKLPKYDPSWKESLVKHEGYLFPDTYLIPKDATIDLIVSIMTNNFASKFTTLNLNNTSLTKDEIVTVASLIEREAKFPNDRPLVASVILNRLNIGMALQIDASIQYLLGYQQDQKTWWKKNLTQEDIKTPSAYNTYTHPGLPPGPIANPGLDAMRSAVSAPKTNYLYYISDKSGKNHYAETIEDHNANIKKYGL